MGEWPRSIGVIGAGAMGRALAAGLALGGRGIAGSLRFADVVPQAAEGAASEVGGRAVAVAEAASCDVVCLAVKPKDVEAVREAVGGGLGSAQVLVSVVAGWSLERLCTAFPGPAVVRLMPNLAVRYGAGLVALAAQGLDAGRERHLAALLEPLGTIVPLSETLFPAATALAGSGPGFVALVAEGLEEGAVGSGLARSDARAMVRAVIAGSAELLRDGADPARLRHQVSSPAGTTVEGVAVLERGAVRAHLADAVRAAARRAAEL